ncbi:MAG: DUF4397 domain-containing protein [Roseiflexaceae bacterium]|nr:DUF4397 domain-containing protein [Roseiflexaceae bacterium]
MKLRMLGILGVLALLFSFLSVSATSANSSITVNPSASARVRIAHASPDAPPVDVYLNGVKKLAGVPFFTASEYLYVPSGTVLVQVAAAGTPVSSSVISTSITLLPDTSYTVAAVGELAAGTGTPISASVITDEPIAPAANNARVRVYHFSPGAPPVGVRIVSGATLASSVTYPAASSAVDALAGTYTLEVFVAAAPTTIVSTLTNVQFEAGKLYDLFAVGKLATGSPGGSPGDEAFRIETVVTDATAKVRIIHAAPSAPSVDVYVGDNKVLTNVPFFTVSDYLTLPAGQYRFRVTVTGQPLSSAIIDDTQVLKVGQFYTITAIAPTGSSTTPVEAKISVEDFSTPTSGTSRVRVYHFSPGTPSVGVRVKGGPVLISSLSFPNISADIEIAAGTYDLEVFATNNQTTLVTISGVQLLPGKILDIFATGQFPNVVLVSKYYSPGGLPGFRLSLPVVNT